jgi:hypothetical protein
MLFDSLTTIFLFATAVAGLPANHEHPKPRSSETTASSAKSGCGSASAWQFDADNHANVTMDDRSFLVHIPAAYDANTRHAVVVSFHGFKQEDSNQETITGLSEKGLKLNGKVRTYRSFLNPLLTVFAGHHCRLEINRFLYAY